MHPGTQRDYFSIILKVKTKLLKHLTPEKHIKAYIDFGIFSFYFIVVRYKNSRFVSTN